MCTISTRTGARPNPFHLRPNDPSSPRRGYPGVAGCGFSERYWTQGPLPTSTSPLSLHVVPLLCNVLGTRTPHPHPALFLVITCPQTGGCPYNIPSLRKEVSRIPLDHLRDSFVLHERFSASW